MQVYGTRIVFEVNFEIAAAYPRQIGEADFNMDGLTDIVLGFFNNPDFQEIPLAIMLNQGDGTFKSAWQTALADLDAAQPLIEIADFNGDGRPDIFLIDQTTIGPGIWDRFLSGAGLGEPAFLLSTENGSYVVNTGIADQYDQIPGRLYRQNEYEDPLLFDDPSLFEDPSVTSRTVSSKTISSGDIDGDGDIDIFLEAQGQLPDNEMHFLINDGNGNFTISWGDRIENVTLFAPGDFGRFEATELADMDGDGHLDVVLGVLRDATVFETYVLI